MAAAARWTIIALALLLAAALVGLIAVSTCFARSSKSHRLQQLRRRVSSSSRSGGAATKAEEEEEEDKASSTSQRWISYADKSFKKRGQSWRENARQTLGMTTTGLPRQEETKISLFGERDIPQEHRALYESLKSRQGGHNGYWVWKPLMIQRELQQMSEGSMLVYMDSRTTVKQAPEALSRHLLDMHERGEIPIYLDSSFCSHDSFCTEEVFEEFRDLVDLNGARALTQVQASGIALLKTSETVRIIEEWVQWCTQDGGRLLFECGGKTTSRANFIDHRHDQAILTMVMFQHGAWTADFRDLAMFQHWGPRFVELLNAGRRDEAHSQFLE